MSVRKLSAACDRFNCYHLSDLRHLSLCLLFFLKMCSCSPFKMLINMEDNLAWAAIFRALERLGSNSRAVRIPKFGTTLNVEINSIAVIVGGLHRYIHVVHRVLPRSRANTMPRGFVITGSQENTPTFNSDDQEILSLLSSERRCNGLLSERIPDYIHVVHRVLPRSRANTMPRGFVITRVMRNNISTIGSDI